MANARHPVSPRNFFLNEHHELSSIEKSGGGRFQQYVDVPWARKSRKLSTSIEKVIVDANRSTDPLKGDHYFVLAKPERTLHKRSQSKTNVERGFVEEAPNFGREHHRVFGKLGLDLVTVTSSGDAIVHAKEAKLEALAGRAKELASAGAREQAQWAVLDLFESIPIGLRADMDWLDSLTEGERIDFVIELQPLLGRVDADRVLNGVVDVLRMKGGKVNGAGADFSGRYWYRAEGMADSVRELARNFYSLQSLHSPLYSEAAHPASARRRPIAPPATSSRARHESTDLPTVGVVDLGVPDEHQRLSAYRRGKFVGRDAVPIAIGHHGSRVASRIVFGECSSVDEMLSKDGDLRFFDILVGDGTDETKVYDKNVVEAMQGVSSTAPDVRVYNLSFGDLSPLGALGEVVRREKLTQVQDLDNFIFANDVAVVVAAGNSAPGLVPGSVYPSHVDDVDWRLGAWASGFNTWVSGCFVGRVAPNGLVRHVGWPSPFCRIGPGQFGAPVPSFSADGGNCSPAYRWEPGLGVWTLSAEAYAEDQIGTSLATPLIAREAAFCLSALRAYCDGGTRPFAVTARAFLALTASKPVQDRRVSALVERTLGYGKPDFRRLEHPSSGSAVVLWQGNIESPKDKVRIQLPIPQDWLASAEHPELRLIVAYDPPVNQAATGLWACRKVNAVLKPGPDKKGLMRTRSLGSFSYSMIDRTYDLAKFLEENGAADLDDLWVLELSYEEIFQTIPQMDFDPRQRVAVAVEVRDSGETPSDPQPFIQRLPAAAFMTRFSVPAAISTPVLVRRRVL